MQYGLKYVCVTTTIYQTTTISSAIYQKVNMATEGPLVRKTPLYKVVLVGEVGVGKSSIFTRFKRGIFNPLGTQTLGLDSFTEELLVDGERCKLNIWDTAGLERTGSLTSHYYHSSHAIVFIYAVDDVDSLNAISHWINDAERYAKSAIRFLAGNKNDLEKDDWEVLEDKAQAFMDSKNFVDKYSISAKTGEGIEEMFESISRCLRKEILSSQPLGYPFHPSGEDSLDLRHTVNHHSGCHC